jgi:hypothetical protein
MVATFDVFYDWGGANDAPGTNTDVDALGPPCIRFKDADNATIDANDKIVVPGAGTKYSYWKHLYLKCSNADGHTMNNFAVYTDGAAWDANTDVDIGTEQPTKNSGSDAGYEVADTDDEDLVTNHAHVTAVTDFFGYTAGEGTDFDVSCSEAGAAVDAINETTDYIALEFHCAAAASPGDLANETGTWSYDEA